MEWILLSQYAFLTSFIATPDARIEADNGYCILWFMLVKYKKTVLRKELFSISAFFQEHTYQYMMTFCSYS